MQHSRRPLRRPPHRQRWEFPTGLAGVRARFDVEGAEVLAEGFRVWGRGAWEFQDLEFRVQSTRCDASKVHGTVFLRRNPKHKF